MQLFWRRILGGCLWKWILQKWFFAKHMGNLVQLQIFCMKMVTLAFWSLTFREIDWLPKAIIIILCLHWYFTPEFWVFAGCYDLNAVINRWNDASCIPLGPLANNYLFDLHVKWILRNDMLFEISVSVGLLFNEVLEGAVGESQEMGSNVGFHFVVLWLSCYCCTKAIFPTQKILETVDFSMYT